MPSIDARAAATARSQFGAVTRAQLRAEGISYDAIARRVADGTWTEPFPGVLDVGSHPRTWRGELARLLLAAGPGACVSHACAAFLHRFLDVPRPPPDDVLVRRGRHAAIGRVRLHTTTRLAEDEVTAVGGLRVTTAARTCLDLASTTSAESLERWLADLARRDPDGLRQVGQLIDRDRRRPGRRALADAVARLPADVAALGSPLEVLGEQALRRQGATGYRLQHRIRDAGGAVVKRVDLAFPDVRIAVEFDGAAWHDVSAARRRDETERARIAALGWQLDVLRRRDLDGGRPRRIVDAVAARRAALRS